MSINGINNNAASWAQFVKLTHAARTRNDGLTAEGPKAAQASTAPKAASAVSFKRVADVYLSGQAAPAQSVQASPSIQSELTRKAAGGLFDAYA
jgi:hypothetical protein